MTLAIGYQLPGNPSLGSPSDHLIVRFVESESAGGSGLGPARPSVLVVDDDPSITSFLRRGLRLEGFEVQVASSGSDGLRLALETHFDLIVLDYMMPDLDGLAVLRQLRAFTQVPVLALTARDEPSLKAAFLGAGAGAILIKPAPLATIALSLRTLLGAA